MDTVRVNNKKRKMNKWQALAVRRKKLLIAELFNFSESSWEDYREFGLLTEGMMPEILVRLLT